MTIFSKALDLNQANNNKYYINEIDIHFLNIDENLIFNQKTINKYKYDKMKINKTYNSYIKKYIAADNSNILGYKKFANILKKEYLL